MKKIISSLVICVFLPLATLRANQNLVSEEYAKFVTGSVADKAIVLQQLEITEQTDSFTATLPELALSFVAENVPIIGNVEGMAQLVLAALPLINIDSSKTVDMLWQICDMFQDEEIKSAIFDAYNGIAINSRQLLTPYITQLHTFVAECIASGSYSSESCIQVVELLGNISDTSSFDLLFRLVYNDYNPVLTEVATFAFDRILPSSHTNIIRLMLDKDNVSVEEKRLLFTLVQKNTKISQILKADLAENALSAAIINTEDVQKITPDAVALQMSAVKEIAALEWTRASATVAKFFLVAQKEYDAGLISENEFLEIISCVETLATTHSVAALSDYLGVLNKTTAEVGNICSEPVVLAVIDALGTLGDKNAFDNLLYVTYLPYSDSVVASARAALAGLKW
ncbi:MAG: hypothetical protein J6B81_01975 [Spirochaetaceae bacterium]|nr:hypothetical protein [Spirochaetaceae bacterium]